MDRPPLDPARLGAALAPGWTVRVVRRTASTNADLLAATTPDRTVLVTEEQTAGRGRFDRVWTSPPGAGLTVSLRVRPATPMSRWGWLPLLAGVALAEAVRAEAGVEVRLKWPNDLLAPDGRKLAGILVQAADGAAVVGVGLNVHTAADELPVDTATSLALAGAEHPDRDGLLIGLAVALDSWLIRWDAAGGDARVCGLAAAYEGLCDTLGREVRVTVSGGATLSGAAIRIDDDGALVVAVDGLERTLSAGDVEHLRPAH